MFELEVEATSGAARSGRLALPHGTIETPCFMPVGTQGTVRARSPNDLRAAGASLVLANTYHLHVRPGEDVVAQLGGLHRFMAWDRPLLTDSGGFQVFSLAGFRRVSDDGVEFQSHLDGARRFLTPERAIEINGRSARTSRWRSTTWSQEWRTRRRRGTHSNERCGGWNGAGNDIGNWWIVG